jgi:signal transduction histidine kinase
MGIEWKALVDMRAEVSPGPPTAGRVLTPGLLAGFVAAALVLILTFVVGLTSLRNVYDTSDAVARTYAVKADLEGLLSTLVDAETGGRGYVITGDEEFLESYTRARLDITGRVNHAASLLQHSAEQEADLGRVAAAAELKMKNVAEGIRLRRAEGFDAAREKVSDKSGKHTMDQLRAIIDRMEAREDTLLAVRVPEADRSYRLASVARGISLGVGLLALAALYVITVRYGRDRMRTTRVLQDQQGQLRETLRLKDEFVAVVSHELRTPTNTIAGWARMLTDQRLSPERSAQAIATISRNAESLRQLIDDLMDTSLLVSGRMRLSTDRVDLATVVRDAVETVRLSADNKGVILLAEMPSRVPLTVIGDSGRLTQVVCNLLANAIKFTPPGGQVAVALLSIATGVKLTVSDTGAGIEPDFLPHVFERFRQGTSGAGAKQGVGLGLAIVQHLVELHGGTITVESAGPGKGACFTVEFPFVAAAHEAATATWSGVGSGK